METLAKVREGYDLWATVYDDDQNPLQALEGPLVQQACGNVQGHRVLDMGCGTGRHALWLAQAGADVTGIYFSEAMLAKAREKTASYSIDLIAHDLGFGFGPTHTADLLLTERTIAEPHVL